MPLCTDQRNADDNCVRFHLCLSLFVCTYPSISRFSFLSSQIQEVLENPEQPKKEKAKVQRTAPPPKKEEEPPAFSEYNKGFDLGLGDATVYATVAAAAAPQPAASASVFVRPALPPPLHHATMHRSEKCGR